MVILFKNGQPLKKHKDLDCVYSYMKRYYNLSKADLIINKELNLDGNVFKIVDTSTDLQSIYDELKRVKSYLLNSAMNYKTITDVDSDILLNYLSTKGIKANIVRYPDIKCYVVERYDA